MDRIDDEPRLRRLAAVALNIVCFSYVGRSDLCPTDINERILERLHADGRVAPSLTYIDGKPALRAALVNHRTTETDIEALLHGVLSFGEQEA